MLAQVRYSRVEEPLLRDNDVTMDHDFDFPSGTWGLRSMTCRSTRRWILCAGGSYGGGHHPLRPGGQLPLCGVEFWLAVHTEDRAEEDLEDNHH